MIITTTWHLMPRILYYTVYVMKHVIFIRFTRHSNICFFFLCLWNKITGFMSDGWKLQAGINVVSCDTLTQPVKGPFASVMRDYIGSRRTILVASLVICIGMVGASFSKTVAHLILTYGLITGEIMLPHISPSGEAGKVSPKEGASDLSGNVETFPRDIRKLFGENCFW